MPSTIITKNGSGAPLAADLVAGELAVDLTNGRLYTENSGGSVIEIGLNPSGNVDVTGTVTADGLTVDGDGNLDGTLEVHNRINTVNGTSGTYGSLTTDFDATNARIRTTYIGGNVADMLPLGIYTGSTKRMEVATGGDISFYEDTGTTAKLFWDASAESLGIGTTSPNSLTHIYGGASGRTWTVDGNDLFALENDSSLAFDIRTPNASQGLILFSDADARAQGIVGYSHSNDFMYFNTNGSEAMRIDSAGNVGIGTASPVSLVYASNAAASTNYIGYNIGNTLVDASNKGGFAIYEQGSLVTAITYNRDGTGDTDYNAGNHVWNNLANTTEYMRIDSSGNLLVGTTSNSLYNTTTETGVQIDGANGNVAIARTSNKCLNLNRLSTDGDIAEFRKDGTTVGSIGATGGDLFIGTGDVGLWFQDGGNAIRPFRVDTQVGHDASIDLGLSSNRFKDLYLSGGVYVGGTGAANYLDDYEEGTWTPTITGVTTNPSVTYAVAVGNYTKVGRLVTVSWRIQVSAISGGSGLAQINGLPFNQATASGNAHVQISALSTMTGPASKNGGFVEPTNSFIYLCDDSGLTFDVSTMGTGLIYGTVSYFTS